MQIKSILNANLRWFLAGMIFANIAGQMAYSTLSLYMLDLGASVAQVGMVFTLASLVPMVLPGYLLQVSVDPWWRSLWAQLHLWASVAWLLAYGAHQLLPRPTSRGLALGGRGGSSEP